ncbi:MAG: PorV/PorQ family protein [Bacteroidota bacterium]|nr:PorV/PorQ family protein [Bacteroidota bacterium]MDP4196581.1 PorV/PorQ family protein [Bacteroidota bacterium]
MNRTPSPKAEAMGSALASIIDNVATQYYNPAALADVNGLNFAYSYSSPYYTLKNAGFNYWGLSCNINQRHSVALSTYSFSTGLQYLYPSSSRNTKQDNLATGVYTLSYSLKVTESFFLGTNFNYFYDEVPNGPADKARVKTYPIDLGVLKHIPLYENNNHRQSLSIGSSIRNLNNSHVELSGEKQWLPSILRFAISYEYTIFKNTASELDPLSVTAIAEYQDVLNSGFYTSIKLGGEVRLYDLISLRGGYFRESLDNTSSLNGLDKVSRFTYGFGLYLPLQKIIDKHLPFELIFSYTSLNQASFVRDFDNWGKYSLAGICIKYIDL